LQAVGKTAMRVACALVALAVVVALCACVPGASSPWSSPYYDWEGFHQQNGRFVYEGEGGLVTETGVDVSDNQGWIDWWAVADDGIDFALIRCGFRGSSEGGLYPDDYFEYNLASAHDAGIACGVYFFSQAVTVEEAQEEARFVLDLLGGVPLEHPVAFDHEREAEGIDSRVDELTGEQATAVAQAFCEVIQDAGYKTMIYGNGYDLARYDWDVLEHDELWYAEYGSFPSCRQPYAVWQYTNDGQVDGIDGAVDLNLGFW